MKRVVVYGKRGEKGYKLRGAVKAERAHAQPKDGEAVLFSADVNITRDPTDALVDVWNEAGLASEDDARRIAVGVKVYGAARKALGLKRADDLEPGYWKGADVNGTASDKRAICEAVEDVWGPKRAAKQAAKLGVDYSPKGQDSASAEKKVTRDSPTEITVKAGKR